MFAEQTEVSIYVGLSITGILYGTDIYRPVFYLMNDFSRNFTMPYLFLRLLPSTRQDVIGATMFLCCLFLDLASSLDVFLLHVRVPGAAHVD